MTTPESGDQRAWRHAIDSGRLAPLSNDELQRIALNAIYTATEIDRRDGCPESEIEAICEWAQKARLQGDMVAAVLDNNVFIRWKDGDVLFSLSPKGRDEGRRHAEQLGLPVADDDDRAGPTR